MAKRVNYTIKRRSNMIDLNEINPGDEVTIRDGGGNLVLGQVHGSTDKLWVKAFDTTIPFARKGKEKWLPTRGIRVVGHLPSMFPAMTG